MIYITNHSSLIITVMSSTNGKKCTKYEFNVTLKEFYENLVTNEKFRDKIIEIFMESPYENALWEFPPYSATHANNRAEFILMETYSFGNADSSSFSEHFAGKPDGEIVVFNNLSGDTNLISVNSADTKNNIFCHIMAFMKRAPAKLKHNLLIRIGGEMSKYTTSKSNVYLSTHGHGVSWLHVRICSKPKYYAFEEYKK